MKTGRWIAIVAGALVVLALWFALEEPRRDSPPAPAPPPPGEPSSAAARGEEEISQAPGTRRSALLREPELELTGVVVTTTGEPVSGARLSLVDAALRQVPGLLEYREVVERTTATGRSESDGSFRFRVEPERSHDLVAEARGFARTRLPNLYAGEEVRLVLPRSSAIFGRITDAADGTPLAAATVEAVRGPYTEPGAARFRATSDPSGTYRLEGLPEGVLQIEVDARDHARVWDRSVALEEGQERRVDFSIERGATVRGRVIDGETKAPIVGATVDLGENSPRRAAVTDGEGRYVLRGVPVANPGRVFASLRFKAPGYGQFQYGLPGVPEGEIEQDVFLLPGRRARGRVLGRDGEAVEGAWVLASGGFFAHGTNQGDRRRAVTDADGRFELDDLRIDMRHTLLVHAQGHATGVFDFPAEEWERREIDLGEIRLERPGTISGRTRDAGGRPLEGYWVSLDGGVLRSDALGPSHARDEGYRRDGGLGFGTLRARTDARGRYAFTGLPSGGYRLSSGGRGNARRATLGIDLEEGGRRLGADLVFDPGLSIEGVVCDRAGIPLAGVGVSASRESGAAGFFAAFVSGKDGAFSLSGLDPGDYVLRANDAFQEFRGPEGNPRRFAGTSMKGIPAGSTGLRLVLSPAEAIAGAVVGSDEKPMPFVQVSFRPQGETDVTGGGATDREGRFLLWVEEGIPGTLVVRSPFSPVFDPEGRQMRGNVVTLDDVRPGTKDLLVRLPEQP